MTRPLKRKRELSENHNEPVEGGILRAPRTATSAYYSSVVGSGPGGDLPTPTEFPTESPTRRLLTEYLTESPIEYLTESPTEFLAESPTEFLAESPTEFLAESPTEFLAEAYTYASSETATEDHTDAHMEVPSESQTIVSIEALTDAPTEAPMDAPMIARTGALTVGPKEPTTEARTDSLTEVPTEAPEETPSEAPQAAPTRPPAEAPTPRRSLAEIHYAYDDDVSNINKHFEEKSVSSSYDFPVGDHVRIWSDGGLYGVVHARSSSQIAPINVRFRDREGTSRNLWFHASWLTPLRVREGSGVPEVERDLDSLVEAPEQAIVASSGTDNIPQERIEVGVDVKIINGRYEGGEGKVLRRTSPRVVVAGVDAKTNFCVQFAHKDIPGQPREAYFSERSLKVLRPDSSDLSTSGLEPDSNSQSDTSVSETDTSVSETDDSDSDTDDSDSDTDDSESETDDSEEQQAQGSEYSSFSETEEERLVREENEQREREEARTNFMETPYVFTKFVGKVDVDKVHMEILVEDIPKLFRGVNTKLAHEPEAAHDVPRWTTVLFQGDSKIYIDHRVFENTQAMDSTQLHPCTHFQHKFCERLRDDYDIPAMPSLAERHASKDG
jgi:hypothetical protein